MPYSLTNYWNDLENALAAFDKDNSSLISSKTDTEDERIYQLQRSTIEKIKDLGKELESTSSIFVTTKINLGNEMEALPIKSYDKEQVPYIKGTKSLEFAKQVYLPHLQRFEKVDFNPVIIKLSKLTGQDLNLKKTKTTEIVAKLQERINSFSKNGSSPHVKLSMLAKQSPSEKSATVVAAKPNPSI